MNAPQPLRSVSNQSSRIVYGNRTLKNLADYGGTDISAARKVFANMLWQAFPSPSENELARKASRVLGASPRQVVNWLRCQNSAPIHVFFAVAAIAGAEIVFSQAGGE